MRYVSTAIFFYLVAGVSYADEQIQVKLTLGKSLNIPIGITNPDSKTQTKISDGPNSLRMKGSNYLIDLQADGTGDSKIGLQLVSTNSGMIRDTSEIQQPVKSPLVKLDFYAKAISATDDGKFAVVWGPLPPQTKPTYKFGPRNQLAVIDVENRRIIQHKEIPDGIECATIDNNYVYYCPSKGNLVVRCDHKLQNIKRQFLEFKPSILAVQNQNTIGVAETVHDTLKFLDVTTLKETTLPTKQIIDFLRRLRLNEGVQLDQRLRPPRFRKLPLLIRNGTVFRNRLRSELRSIDSGYGVSRWGRIMYRFELVDTDDTKIARIDAGYTRLSKYLPTLIAHKVRASGSRNETKHLVFYDLSDGTEKARLLICEDQYGPQRDYNGQASRYFFEAPDEIIVVNNDQVLMLPRPDGLAEKLSIPTHLKEEQTQEIDVESDHSFPILFGGSSKDIKIELSHKTESFKINQNTGVIQIDGKQLWERLVENAVPNSRTPTRFSLLITQGTRRSENFEFAEIEKEYFARTKKKLPADKLASIINFSVKVTDPAGRTDKRNLSVIVRGPRKPFIDKFNGKNSKSKSFLSQLQQAAMAEVNKSRRIKAAKRKQAAKQTESKSSSPLKTSEQLDELEKRLRRFESKLESALQALNEIELKKAGQVKPKPSPEKSKR